MKYHMIICAILKDETPYLVEWVEHHLGIGVEHFVLYDNNSVIPAKQTLEAYVRKGVVEVI
ncbi:MAG: glycosyltransferase family 92 protein, partial [Alistipes indistinctus]|nr:glycosyltransferase family 92 protein [Alistipes indistinctus]